MPFNSIFSWFIKKRIHQIDLFKKYPLEVQQEVFNTLIDRAKCTEFGKMNQFIKIKNYSNFNKYVPLNNYETLKPFIDRVFKNEQND
mgnify:CR=1 FL=1